MPDASSVSGRSPQFESPEFGHPEAGAAGDEEDFEDGPEAGLDGDFEDEDDGGDFADEDDDDGGNDEDDDDGGTARAVLDHIARSLVDDPDAVEIDVSEARNGVRLSLHVSPPDMGRVIGKRGRVAQAIRTVVRAAAAHDGTDALVDIVDA